MARALMEGRGGLSTGHVKVRSLWCRAGYRSLQDDSPPMAAEGPHQEYSGCEGLGVLAGLPCPHGTEPLPSMCHSSASES